MDIVVTTVPSDSHTWNLVLLQILLEEAGHRVVNLGPCVPVDHLLAECEQLRPDLVVVSTVNGHGGHDALGLMRRFRRCPALAGTRVVLGGKLGIRDSADDSRLDELVSAGYDRVFPEHASLDALLADLDSIAPAASRHHGVRPRGPSAAESIGM